MGIRLKYGMAVGILAALFSILGPVSAQASHMHATSVPAVSHSSAITSRTVAPDYRCGYGHYDRHCCDHYGGGYNRYCCYGYSHYDHYCYDHYGHYNRYCCYGHYSHHGHYSR